LCRGDSIWSKSAYQTLSQSVAEYYALLCNLSDIGSMFNPLSINFVPPNELLPQTAISHRMCASDSLFAVIRCTTDFESRDLEIRCGPKKSLQNWKKYVHVVSARIFWSDIANTRFHGSVDFSNTDMLDLEPNQTAGGDVEKVKTKSNFETKEFPAENIKCEDDLVRLDLWLEDNSFIKGAFFQTIDQDIRQSILRFTEESSFPLPAVQYPHITRWLNTFE